MGGAGHLGVGNPPGCSDGSCAIGRSDLHTEAGYISCVSAKVSEVAVPSQAAGQFRG